MPLLVEQIIYTSFSRVGFTSCVSPSISPEIQQAFIQNIVYQYWNPYHPPAAGYRGVYLQQLSFEQTLFGWLYNDGSDDLGRSHIPYFIGYFLVGRLDISQLNLLWNCLEAGPVLVIDRHNPPPNIESIIIPDSCHYQSPRLGVCINRNIREQSAKAWQQGQLINQFIAEDIKNPSLNRDPLNHKYADHALIPLPSSLQFSQRTFMKTPTIDNILQDLALKPIGIQGVALVSQEGQPISVPIGLDEHSTSIISGTMLYLAQSTQNEFNWQDIEMISIRGKKGHIILAYCSQEICLLIKAGKVLTGLLEGEISRTVKKLQTALQSLDTTPLQSEILPQLFDNSVPSEPEVLGDLRQEIHLETDNEFRYRGRPTNGT